MDKIYEIIENKIKSSGYQTTISGFEIYNELSNFIEDKEIGSYLFMSNKDADTIFEYKVDIMNDDFNLSYINITVGEQFFHIDFDN